MVWLILLMLLNAAFVAAFPSPTVFYIVNVLLHPLLGLAVVAVLFRKSPGAKRWVLAAAALLGAYLLFAGATRDHFAILWGHIALAVAGMALLMPRWKWTFARHTSARAPQYRRCGACAAAGSSISPIGWRTAGGRDIRDSCRTTSRRPQCPRSPRRSPWSWRPIRFS